MKTIALMAVLLLAPGLPLQARQLPRDHPLFEYNAMLAQFWGRLYAGGGESLYCAEAFGPHKGARFNAEHVFPMSWVARALKCGKRSQCRRNNPRFRAIETDMHNIWPALARVNKARRNFAYAMISGEHHRFRGCDIEIDDRQRRVEPRPAVRGDIARSMFYMRDRYGLYLKPRLSQLLARWHREDPPDREEHRRNAMIENLQGRRNRFIDQPALIAAPVPR